MITLRFIRFFIMLSALVIPSLFANKNCVVFPPKEELLTKFKESGLEEFNTKTDLINKLLNGQKNAELVLNNIRLALLKCKVDLQIVPKRLVTILVSKTDPETFNYCSKPLENLTYEENSDGSTILVCKIFVDSFVFIEKRFCDNPCMPFNKRLIKCTI